MTATTDATAPATAEAAATAAPRPTLRSVALPSEHGGWGLTAEPVVASLMIAPSIPGACLGGAAFLAFLARTPCKLVAVDRRRGRTLPRTRLARRVAVAELTALAALVISAWIASGSPGGVPLLAAAPIGVVEAWFDVRSRGRRLVPELAGAVAVASVAAMIVLAGGRSATLAFALWSVLAARAVTSIPWVRAQVARLHARPTATNGLVVADLAALALAAGAAALDRRLLAGAVAAAIGVAVQRWWARSAPPRAVVLGLRQTALGFGLAIVTAVGVLALG